LVDDERKLADKNQFSMAETIVAGDYDKVFSDFEMGSGDFAVVAHGEPEHDYLALKKLVEKNPAFIGLLGSQTKAQILTQRLSAEGVSDEQIKRLHAPVGLDIGAETPEEIGISILAEIIQFRETGRKEKQP